MEDLDEITLQEILKFIKSEEPYRHLGGSLTTYPGAEPFPSKHDYCLELENQKLIERLYENEKCVVWKAK